MYKIIFVSIFITTSHAVRFQIKNNLPGQIWVGILGNGGKPALAQGGFKLAAHAEVIFTFDNKYLLIQIVVNKYLFQRSIDAPDDWAGRFWARTWCNDQTNHCETGDCGNKVECNGAGGVPPATLAEITLKGHEGLDFYDISLVDGFNVAASVRLNC